ncbi:MAG TPA: hypothetical protein GXX70_08740 [Tepidimicrobium sp.]|nr:hypothetical protein [Tepidimicrobium sp.]
MSDWPIYREENHHPEVEKQMAYIMEAIKGIRNARQKMNIAPSKKAPLLCITQDERIKEILDYGRSYFINLSSASDISILEDKSTLGDDNLSVVLDKCEIFIPLKDLIDYNKEISRLEKEKEKLEGELKRVKDKLSNKNFVNKAPKNVVDAEREKEKKYMDMMDRVVERLESLKSKQ